MQNIFSLARMSRFQYVISTLIVLILLTIVFSFSFIANGSGVGFSPLAILGIFPLFYGFILMIRRLRDIDLSGWYLLIPFAISYFAPPIFHTALPAPFNYIVGYTLFLAIPIFAFILMFIPGTQKKNKYGKPNK